jgi:hypothetical protein
MVRQTARNKFRGTMLRYQILPAISTGGPAGNALVREHAPPRPFSTLEEPSPVPSRSSWLRSPSCIVFGITVLINARGSPNQEYFRYLSDA